MATQTRPDHRNTAYDARITTDGHTHGRAQGTSENYSYSRSEPEPTPASSGWISDATSERLFHTSPSRCWWRAGGLNPSEYGNAGAHPSARPISRGAAARESRLISDTFHKTPSVQPNERYLALVRRSIHCMSFIILIISYLGFGEPSLLCHLIAFLLASSLFVYIRITLDGSN